MISLQISPISLRQLSIWLTIVSIPLWLLSIFETKLVIGFYGILFSLSVFFFLALALVVAGFLILCFSRQKTYILPLQLILIITFLWLTPFLIGASEMVAWHGFTFFGFVDYILRQGQLAPQILWYHQWPGNWIGYTEVINIFGISNFGEFINTLPIIWQFLYFLPLFVFLRNTIGKDNLNYCWIGMLIFYLGNWLGLSYIGPQSLAYFLFLVFLALLTRRWNETAAQNIMLSLIMLCLTVVHPEMSLVAFSVLIALYVTKRIKSKLLVFTSAFFYVSWMIYSASLYLQSNLVVFITEAFRFDIFLNVGLVNRVVGSASHEAVVYIRILTTVVFVFIAFLGFITSRKTNKSHFIDNTVLVIAIGILVITITSGAVLHENTERSFFYLLPVVGYFGVKCVRTKPTLCLLVVLIVIAFPLHFISQYGNQIVDYNSSADHASLYFFDGYTYHTYLVGVVPPRPGSPGVGQPFGWFSYVEEYRGITLERFINGTIASYGNSAIYIPIGLRDKAIYDFVDNDSRTFDAVSTSLESSCNLVYSNPREDIYFIQKTSENLTFSIHS